MQYFYIHIVKNIIFIGEEINLTKITQNVISIIIIRTISNRYELFFKEQLRCVKNEKNLF